MKRKGSLILVLSQDVIFKPFFLHKLLEKLKKNNIKVSKIIEVSTKNSSTRKSRKNSYMLWGPVAYAQFFVIFAAKKIISALPINILFKWKSTVKLIAKKNSIDYLFIDDLNKYLSFDNISKDDIVFSFQHQIIKNPEKYDFLLINCHPGDLSFYRGIKPIFWAMLDCQKRNYISIHLIDSGIDTGSLILEKSFKLKESLADNYFEAYKISSQVVCNSIKILLDNCNKSSYHKKKTFPNSYKSYPKKKDIFKFNKLNHKRRISLKNFLKLLKTF